MNYLYFLYNEFLSFNKISQFFCDVTFFTFIFIIISVMLLITILALVLAERKILAYLTQRQGPNRVGYKGCMQTLADAFKLLCKENITPHKADKVLFNLAPVLIFTPIPIILGLIPYCSEFTFMNFQINLLLFTTIAIFPALSILIAGFASNNKYALLGGIRSVAQILSYELPIAFSVLSITILASSLNLTQITISQISKYGFLSWYIFPCFLGFIIMLISITAELNRCPFDLPEAESELICGYNTEYSGIRFALFYLSEYGLLFANSILLSILFLGGYSSPFGKYLSSFLFNEAFANMLLYFEQIFWLLVKSSFIIFILFLFRATFPRLSSKDLLDFSWTKLLPLSIFNALIILLIKLIFGANYV